MLYVVLDDVGFSAMEPYGGLIETPNIKRIAERGLTYTNFHTTALCSPTRSCLLTGRNHTTNGMACITEAHVGVPERQRPHPVRVRATSPRCSASAAGTPTWSGKWHLCAEDEMNLASSKRQWPLGRGFERYYGFLGGETNQWYPDLVHDNHPVEQPASAGGGLPLRPSTSPTRRSSSSRTRRRSRPTSRSSSTTAPAPRTRRTTLRRSGSDRYRGKFDMGYEAYRELVFERQKELGIIPEDAELSPINPYADTTSHDGKPWSELDTRAPVGLAVRRREAAVRAGWPRSTRAS